MKSFIAILLLSICLGSTSEVHELLKIPILIGHFMEHRSENRQMSFWDFMILHYAKGEVKDADYNKDMRLPFKSLPELTGSILLIALIPELQLPDAKYSFAEAAKGVDRKDLFIRSGFLTCIWQPPKYC